jgi:tryptophan-rich sensory protein
MRVALALAGFIALTFLAPLAGASSPPGDWYRTLVKPSWNPPAWIFGPVWTFLYLTIGVAAWGVWKRAGWHRALVPWAGQLALNAAWTPVFFGLRQMGWAFVVIVLLWGAIVATIAVFAKVERWTAWLLAPYLAWVSFATWLNFTLWRLNG